MKSKFVLFGLLMSSVVGCTDLFSQLTEEEIPHFKPVDGKVAAAALGSTVSEVIGELDSILSQSSSGIASPNSVTPPDELFEDEAAASAAPGYRTATHEENHLSEWRGPEVGPDGEAGWYYRETTATVWDYSASESVVAGWRYWMRFEPAHDIKADGVKSVSASHTNYAWTSETGPWAGWKYVIRFGVTTVDVNADGTSRPAQVEGSWLWEITSAAKHYRLSSAKGEYVYAIGDAELLFSNDHDDEEAESDPYMGLKVGDSRAVDFAGKGHWSYTGQHATMDNVIAGKWYGGGDSTRSGSATIRRSGETTLDADITFGFESRGYWGQGEGAQAQDLDAPPEFAKDVTPAGDAWGIPQWIALHDNELTQRDGLLYWHEGNGGIVAQVAWDVVKVEAAEQKIDDAYAVIDGPDSTQEEINQAYTDLSQAYEEQEAAFTKRDTQFRHKSLFRTWNGQEHEGEYVSCSSPELAEDCPVEEEQFY